MSETMTFGRRLVLSSAIVLNAINIANGADSLRADTEPAETCLQPDAADFARADDVLDYPILVPPSVSRGSDDFWPDDMPVPGKQHPWKAVAEYMDTTYVLPEFMASMDAMPREPEHNRQNFLRLQEAVRQHVGIGLSLRDEDVVINGSMDQPEADRQYARSVSADEIGYAELYEIATNIAGIPVDFYEAGQVRDIVLYRLDPTTGGPPGFYVHATHSIHVEVSNPNVIPHELGHALHETGCPGASGHDPDLTALNGPYVYGGPDIQRAIPKMFGDRQPRIAISGEAYAEKYGDAIADAAAWEDADKTNNITVAEAERIVSAAYGADARRVISVSDYGMTSQQEDSAEMGETLLGNNGESIDRYLNPDKPVLYAKMRLTLARYFALMNPGPVRFVLMQKYEAPWREFQDPLDLKRDLFESTAHRPAVR